MSADLSLLQAALIGYQHQQDQVEAKIAEIRSQLGEKGVARKPMSPASAGQHKRWAAVKLAEQPAPKKRKMSAAGRKRIADATRKRWAEYRAKKAAAK
jgi:hypothetical protein